MPDPIRFGECEVSVVERQLRVAGRPVPVGARAFGVLEDLLAHRHRVVTKNELLDRVWAGLVVEENNLPTQISTLRKVLGANVIATIPGRGYRFAAAVASDAGRQPPQADADADTGAARPGEAASTRPRTNLPARLPPLIGRDADLAELADLVAAQRAVSVVGGGGAGKTRLVQALAWQQRERHHHGVCWVGLAATRDPASLASVVAEALGVGLGTGQSLPALLAALAPLDLLLVLDNAEHLRDAVADMVTAIESAAAGVRVVVTSQAPLRIAVERVFRLRDLEVPPSAVGVAEARRFGAVALLVDRASAADSRFALGDDNVTAVVAICRSLHGVALALELAAARVPVLGVARLADSLDQRFRLLTRAPGDGAPERQQTLRAALEWSHALLDEAAKVVFRRLGVLTGSASLEVLQALAEASEEPSASSLDVLSDLVDRSLVGLVVDDDDECAPPRYRLHESPRLYALERLDEAGETEAMRKRHAQVMTQRLGAALPARWDGSESTEHWRSRLAPDIDDARAAFAWASDHRDAASALRLGAVLLYALPWSSHAERGAIADACTPLLDDAVLAVDLRLQAALAACSYAFGSRALDMRDLALSALALSRRSGDRFGLYAAFSYLASAEARLDHGDAAEAALAEMRELEDPAWPPHRRALGADAEYLAGRSDPARVLALTRRQMALSRECGGNAWLPLLNLVDAELQAGHAEAAAAYGDELLEMLRPSRDERGTAYALLNLVSVRLALDDLVAARALAEKGWPLATRFDLQAYWGDVLSLLAVREQRPRQAARLAGFADARYRKSQEARLGNESRASAVAVAACRDAIGDAEFERLRADGETLVDADIAGLALAVDDR